MIKGIGYDDYNRISRSHDLPEWLKTDILAPMNNSEMMTWYEINLGAIRKNIQMLTHLTGVPILAVVKANGYGHGMVEVSRVAEEEGVAWLGVARVEEGVRLRQEGIQTNILVMGYTPPDTVPVALQAKLTLAVFHPETAQAYQYQAAQVNGRLPLHVKFDSGMGRLGYFPEDGLDFVRWITQQPNLILDGIFTHLACADEPENPVTNTQLERFDKLIGQLGQQQLIPKWVHAANSAGAIYFPQARYNLVRPGIALYGQNPSPQAPLPVGFLPAMSFKSRLSSIKTLPADHGVSYGHRYRTRKPERVGVVSAGYADGYRRSDNAYVLIRGKRVPGIGVVCMDQMVVSLDQVPDAQVGDEVILFGHQGRQTISVDELAREWGTITYEVICAATSRPFRVYIDNTGDKIES